MTTRSTAWLVPLALACFAGPSAAQNAVGQVTSVVGQVKSSGPGGTRTLACGDTVYAGADGRWWHQLRGQGTPVELLVRGETLVGQARAIEDDPDHRSAVFDRLRPSAPKLFGTLVQIDLAPRP